MSVRHSHRYPSRSPSPVSKDLVSSRWSRTSEGEVWKVQSSQCMPESSQPMLVRKRYSRSWSKSSADSSSSEDDSDDIEAKSRRRHKKRRASGSHNQSKHNKKRHKKKPKKSRLDSCSSDYSSGGSIGKLKKSKLKKHSTRISRHPESKSHRKKKHKHGRKKDSDITDPAADMRHLSSSTTSNIMTTTPSDKSSSLRRPMTKEEYEKQQSVVRRVLDPETGRHRLVKGDGEIIEEIVSKERHKAINKQATLGDGLSFQSHIRNCL